MACSRALVSYSSGSPKNKQTGARRNRFFSASVLNLWNDLDEKTVAVDTVEKFKRKLSEFEY